MHFTHSLLFQSVTSRKLSHASAAFIYSLLSIHNHLHLATALFAHVSLWQLCKPNKNTTLISHHHDNCRMCMLLFCPRPRLLWSIEQLNVIAMNVCACVCVFAWQISCCVHTWVAVGESNCLCRAVMFYTLAITCFCCCDCLAQICTARCTRAMQTMRTADVFAFFTKN